MVIQGLRTTFGWQKSGSKKVHKKRNQIMASKNESPYVCHIFVCTNDRSGQRKSCADGNSPLVRAALKEEIAKRSWKPRVRVSQSGCLGLCSNGPNVILYPQKVWFSEVSPSDVAEIIAKVEEFLVVGSEDENQLPPG
jgi:(2Fe-2S) ferredoxin